MAGGHPVDPVDPVCGAEYPHRAFTSASGGGNSAVPSGKPTFRGHSNQHRTYSNPWAIDHRRTTRRNPRRRVPQPPLRLRRRVRPSLTRRQSPARRSNRPFAPAIPRSCRDAGFPHRGAMRTSSLRRPLPKGPCPEAPEPGRQVGGATMRTESMGKGIPGWAVILSEVRFRASWASNRERKVRGAAGWDRLRSTPVCRSCPRTPPRSAGSAVHPPPGSSLPRPRR